MKNKFQYLIIVIMGICVLICSICTLIGCTKEPENEEPERLVIETLPECTNGTFTILDDSGGVYFQYEGKINIINNGENGQPIKITINLPDTGCSCFDDEGRLKE